MPMHSELIVNSTTCPQAGAPLPELLQFALTFNGYTRVASSPSKVSELLEPFFREWKASRTIPEWAGLDTLRGALFWVQRGGHHRGDEAEQGSDLRELVAAIRNKCGDRPLVADSF